MNIWMITSLLVLLSSTYLVTGHGDETHSGFEGDPFSNDGCNEVRGCFDCRDSVASCDVNVAWEPDPNEGVVKFTLWGNKNENQAQAHVSLGITSTADMFSADVYSCISDDTGLILVRSWNPSSGRSTTPAALKGVFGQEVTEVDGEIRCQFYRNMSLDDGDSQFLDISGNNSYFLILARGGAGGGAIFGHDGANRGWSGLVVLSQTFSAEAGESDALLMKLHGCLMIIAWIGLASVGLTMARYFKPMWPDSKLCGVKIWFAVHRACMILAVLLFIIGFIVIFVHVNGFVTLSETGDGRRRFVHAVLGVIVTALGIINPIMALFRPHPGTPKRPIFNWAHWAVGTSALILSLVTIGLALAPIPFGDDDGVNILPGLQGYTFWVLIGFCAFIVLMWIIFEVVRCATDSEGRSDDIPLSDKNETVQATEDRGPAFSIRTKGFYARHSNERYQTTRELIGSAIRQFCIERNILVMESEGSMLKTLLLFIFSLGAVFVVAFLIITIAIA